MSNDNSSDPGGPNADGSILPRWATAVIAVAAGLGGILLGYPLGQSLVYAIATATDRDIAELKDMLIWGAISGPIVGAAGSVWLALLLVGASRRTRTVALTVFGLLTVACGSIMVSAFDWPKASGTPSVRYELRLPSGTEVHMGNINFAIWAGRSGHGVYIDRIAHVDGRPQIRGDFTLRREHAEEFLALRIGKGRELRWRVPIAPDAKLEKDYGSWQRIEFLPDNAPAANDGYEIRYRVRKCR